jgi:hypothetical protein
MNSLRSRLIRLAVRRPALRAHLLPLLRHASYEIRVRSEGADSSLYAGELEGIRSALLAGGFPRDRVIFLFSDYPSEVRLRPVEIKALLRASAIRRLPTSQPPKILTNAQAQVRYERLVRRLGQDAGEDWRSDAGGEGRLFEVAPDLAANILESNWVEFAPLLKTLGISRREAQTTIADWIVG